MTKSLIGGLVMAVHPTKYGFGWVVFEAPYSPVDWGLASGSQRNAKLLKRFQRVLARHSPWVVIFEAFEGAEARRAKRIQELCRVLIYACQRVDIATCTYARSSVQACFSHLGAVTRHEIAVVIASKVQAMDHKLPPIRRAWMTTHPRQALFDAAALALTHFASLGHSI